MTTTVSWLLLLIVQLNRDFHRADDIQRSDAGIYLPDDDYARVRNLLAIIPIEDGHVRTRRPINHLANFVSVGSFSLLRNRTRQMSKFLSANQIVHCQREWQQRNKVTGCKRPRWQPGRTAPTALPIPTSGQSPDPR